jgi:peptidoglycan-associated lipoprotein
MRTWMMHTAIALATARLLAGCGDKPEPEVPEAPAEEAAPAAPLTAPQESAIANAETETGAGGLGIQDEILKLCPAVKPPRFSYDSAKVKQDFRNTLVALADCMKEGGLKGKELLLVGHADPRGEEDYNMALGGRRAESVRGALDSLGVEKSRMDVSSRGELEATGSEESGYAKDRRVDIKLKVN